MIARRFNPFVPDKTADPSRFEGRKEEIEEILQSLHQTKFGSPTHIMITGERGIGKSSLLGYGEKLARDGVHEMPTGYLFLTIPIDLAGVETHQEITRRVGRRLRDRLRDYNPGREGLKQIVGFLLDWEFLGVKYDGGKVDLNADEALDALIDQLVLIERSGYFHGTFLLVDEADVPPVSAQLATWCKSLIERLETRESVRFMLALAGQEELQDKLREDHRSVLRNLRPIVLGTLSPSECREAILAGVSFGNETDDFKTTISEEAIDALTELSDGYPHFLQHYCSRAFEEDYDGEISIEDVEASRSRAVAEIGDKFFERRFVTEIGSDDYRRLLYYLANRGSGWHGRQEMIRESGISERVVDNALRSLLEIGFLVKDPRPRSGTYRLASNALATWLQVRPPVS